MACNMVAKQATESETFYTPFSTPRMHVEEFEPKEDGGTLVDQIIDSCYSHIDPNNLLVLIAPTTGDKPLCKLHLIDQQKQEYLCGTYLTMDEAKAVNCSKYFHRYTIAVGSIAAGGCIDVDSDFIEGLMKTLKQNLIQSVLPKMPEVAQIVCKEERMKGGELPPSVEKKLQHMLEYKQKPLLERKVIQLEKPMTEYAKQLDPVKSDQIERNDQTIRPSEEMKPASEEQQNKANGIKAEPKLPYVTRVNPRQPENKPMRSLIMPSRAITESKESPKIELNKFLTSGMQRVKSPKIMPRDLLKMEMNYFVRTINDPRKCNEKDLEQLFDLANRYKLQICVRPDLGLHALMQPDEDYRRPSSIFIVDFWKETYLARIRLSYHEILHLLRQRPEMVQRTKLVKNSLEMTPFPKCLARVLDRVCGWFGLELLYDILGEFLFDWFNCRH